MRATSGVIGSLAMLAGLLVVTACDSPTAPQAPAGSTNNAPAIPSMTVVSDGSNYLQADLKASVTDQDGDLGTVVVDWGDGTTITETTGFGALAPLHQYAEAGRSYTVTLTALDAANHRAVQTRTFTLAEAPHACLDIKLFSTCLQVHPDFKGLTFQVGLLGNTVDSFELNSNKTHFETYLSGGVGVLDKLVLDAAFSSVKGKSYLRARMYGCLFVSMCPTQLSDRTARW